MNDSDPAVLVAFDDSPEAERALLWGAELSRRRGTPLRLCIAKGDLYSLSAWTDTWTRELADEWAADAQKILDAHGYDAADVEIVRGLAAPVLIARSSGAWCVVCGSKGHGRLSGALMGSVTQHLALGSHSPMVTVRAQEDPESRDIVVGVDGSATSEKALEFALELATNLGGQVRALYCEEPWEVRGGAFYADPGGAAQGELREYEGVVRSGVERISRGHPDISVELEIAPGAPVGALVSASKHAAMVVVGSHGRGAFAAMLVGSVSFSVLARAHCPVVLTR